MAIGDGNDPAGTDPEGTDPEGSGAGEGQEDKGKETKEDRLFTKADVEREIANRLKREKAANKDLADKARKFDELEAANRTEAEKAAAAQLESEKKAEAAETRAKALALKSAVTSACLKFDIPDVEIVRSLIGDPSKWEFDADDGEPLGVDERVSEIVKARPFLKGTKFAGSADGGKTADKVDLNDPEELGKLGMEEYLEQRAKRLNKT